jgi:preprotein translocase subunit SecE
MAKKAPKQGKKGNKGNAQQSVVSGQKPTAATVPGQKSIAVEQKVAEKADRKVEKKAEKKPAKEQARPAKEQPKAAKGGKSAPKKEGIVSKVLTYFKNVRLEIKRTTWPTRDEVLRMSLIVMGALLFFGVFIFIFDWLTTQFIEFYSSLAPGADVPTDIPTDTTTDVPTDTSTDTPTDTTTDTSTDTPATSDSETTEQ